MDKIIGFFKPKKEEPMNQLSLFDYQQLDAETRIVVQQRTSEIKALMKRTAQDIIEIGEKLIEVKERLGHGHFGTWLEGEFDWKERTARNFMAVAEQFKSANFADLDFAPSALYLLAAPSTPPEARQEAIERAEQGETITHRTAQEIVAEHKPPVPPQVAFESTQSAPVMEIVEAEIVPEEFSDTDPQPGEAEMMTEMSHQVAHETEAAREDQPQPQLESPPAAEPRPAAPAVPPPPPPPLPPPPVVREAAWVLSLSKRPGAPVLVTILHGADPQTDMPAEVAEEFAAAVLGKKRAEAEAEAEWLSE